MPLLLVTANKFNYSFYLRRAQIYHLDPLLDVIPSNLHISLCETSKSESISKSEIEFFHLEWRDNCKIDQCVDASLALLRFLTYALYADVVNFTLRNLRLLNSLRNTTEY